MEHDINAFIFAESITSIRKYYINHEFVVNRGTFWGSILSSLTLHPTISHSSSSAALTLSLPASNPAHFPKLFNIYIFGFVPFDGDVNLFLLFFYSRRPSR